MSILQPAKVATPDAAASEVVGVQVSVAPAGVVMLRVMGAALVVTVFPNASCTVAEGWELNALPLVPVADGCVVKDSFVAVPGVMAMELLVAVVRPDDVAVSV